MLKFFQDRNGATAIEYALIAAGIGVAVVITVYAIGDSLNGVFEAIGNALPDSK